jgi:hypothetical protein
MIVKRLTQALKRQDWALVGIEFVLVVVGVLLAFQINEWASEREARNERNAATERLLEEAEQNVAYVRLGMSLQQKSIDELGYALGQVQAGQWRTADQQRMVSGLQAVTMVLPLAPPSAVYDDLLASGVFGKIGDVRLRSAIARYRATLKFHDDVVGYFRATMPTLEDHAALHYRFNPGGRRRVRLDVDFQALANDQLLQEKLALLADGQRVRLLITKRALKGASEMCVELGRFVGRACNLNRPPPTFD